jgi:hypothetical protein
MGLLIAARLLAVIGSGLADDAREDPDGFRDGLLADRRVAEDEAAWAWINDAVWPHGVDAYPRAWPRR